MRTLKCKKTNPFRTPFKVTKKFYLWFCFPSQVADILDTENERGNGHSFHFEGKRKW